MRLLRRNQRNPVVKERTLSEVLAGGDRRSIGASNEVAAKLLRRPHGITELIECLWTDDAVVRMRAADAAEKVSAAKPGLLQPFKSELFGLAEETLQIEVRWHLALILPRLILSASEKDRARSIFGRYLEDRS